MNRRALTAALAALTLIGSWSGCNKKEGGPAGGAPAGKRGPMQFPVQVLEVGARDVEYAVSAVGTVEAWETIQVTARVQGVVDEVEFAEGTEVKKGQVLAEIEPARYRLAVDAAKASLEKAVAERDDAKVALQRREAANEETPGLIRAEELETFRTRVRTAAAEADSRRVALDQAKLNLRDAYLRAPADGVIETRTVQTGQYAQPGSVLATLVQRDPMRVRFDVPEAESERLRSGMALRFTTRDAAEPFTAQIRHVGGAADARTRMVEVTAEIDDERRAELRPGTFAQVTVPVASSHAPVIPQTAIRPSERGFLAYVVEGGNLARERVVTLGMRTPDGLVEVRSGLAPKDNLVVRGAEALRDGVPVRISEGAGADVGTARTEIGSRPVVEDGGTPRGAP